MELQFEELLLKWKIISSKDLKEKDEAFDYGGFHFEETLNLIDNLEKAKQSLKNDESLILF